MYDLPICMKVNVNLTIDHKVKKEAQKVIEKLGTSLSQEVENFLKLLVENHKEK